MYFELQFHENATLTYEQLTDADALRRHFPFTAILRYRGAPAEIVQYRYSRTSLQIDRYQVQAVAPCPIHITADTDVYVLVVIEQGGVRYGTTKGQSKEVALRAGECRILFAKKGVYRAELHAGETRLHVICLAPELLHLLDEDFAELRAFMAVARSRQLAAMPAQRMDSTFLARFERLLYTPYPTAREYTRHFLREIPALISAYKGLVKGRDRPSTEVMLMENVLVFISERLDNMENVTVDAICTEFPVSRKKLERLFKKYHHTQPTAYIRQKKLSSIAYLLRHTNLPVYELSIRYGFGNIESLSRAFKKAYGVPPTIYRNK